MRKRPNYSWITDIKTIPQVCSWCNKPLFWWVVTLEIELFKVWCNACMQNWKCDWPENWHYIVLEDYENDDKFIFHKNDNNTEYFD